ncbi:hypothetical protein SAMN04487846_0760 [Microbacterium sp. cf046]|uniref:hypothetical protein n=1 Tax=Microbacterium sp. cf046 TaxID=1761803 RepID=UPI0008E38D85|nr:hypothetical protein [Microbacterium sp. cf046]SFR93174.1 hypothetical protein SAMN04487846_0760 [Microbacterium sp. cf046]
MRTVLGRAGWVVLLVTNTLMLLNHLIGIAFVAASTDERQMFVAYAAVNALAVLVLLFPYRARLRWAWWASWIPVLAIGAVFFIGGLTAIGWAYGLTAVVMTLAQLATLRDFFRAT